MRVQTNLMLFAFALCVGCADSGSTVDDDMNFATPFGQGTDSGVSVGASIPDASVDASLVVPAVDAATPVPTIDAHIPVPDAGTVQPVADSAVPAVDAAVDSGAPTSSTTTCSGTYNGMAGSTADLMLNGRNYTLHIGKSVDPSKPSPLVFSLHGLTMTPASMEFMAHWDPLADTEGLIIARPAGIGSQNGWDLTGTKDFDLMKAIIEDVDAKACVDRQRIYATGFSHGGFMSFSLACRLGDIFAAVAPNSGAGSAARGCVARAVPVYAFHGDADPIVSYSSGQNAVNSWVSHDQCTGSPETYTLSGANCQDWNMCAENSEVKFCTIPGGGHSYSRFATAAIWEFFKAHPLP